jgi:hypothetical protein
VLYTLYVPYICFATVLYCGDLIRVIKFECIIPYRKTIKRHAESFLVAIKEFGLDINSGKNMYECMFMYCEQNARQNRIHSFIL